MNKNLLFAAAMAMTATTAMAQKLKYPEAPHDNTVDTYFGEKVADPFRPLEDDNSETTAKWVKEENALTRSYLDKMPQRSQYLKRLKEVSNYEKVSRWKRMPTSMASSCIRWV